MKKSYLKLVRSSLRSLRHPRLRHRWWWQTLSKPIAQRSLWIPCRDTVANGSAIGVFFSMIPIPFQMVPAALIAMRAKANIPFALASCWVTNPVTIGPILWMQYSLGKWMHMSLGISLPHFLSRPPFKFPQAGIDFLLGMTTSAIVCALLVYPIVYLFSAIMPHHLPVRRRKRAKVAESAPSEP